MNYLRAVELGYDVLGMMAMIGNVDLKERHSAVAEARWLGLSTLEDILTNMPDFTRQELQARVPINNNASAPPYPTPPVFATNSAAQSLSPPYQMPEILPPVSMHIYTVKCSQVLEEARSEALLL